MMDQGTFRSLSSSDQMAARAYARTLYLQVNFASTTLNYQTLEVRAGSPCKTAIPRSTRIGPIC